MIINVKVKPNRGEQKIEESNGGLIVSLKSYPENNKANIELLKLLKKHFGKDIKIIKGKNSRNKVIEVKNAN